MEHAPKDTSDMATKVNYMTLTIAEGGIEATTDQWERLDDITERLGNGEFHVPIQWNIPFICIDGRPGCFELGPSSAGGTFTQTVADDLTSRHFSDGKTLAEAHREVLSVLMREGNRVGGHCDNHAAGENCGCGAQDRIEKIYKYMVNHAGDIRELVGKLDVSVSDQVHNLIIGNASDRTEFSTGAQISAALVETAGEETQPTLEDDHNEVVAVINLREGTTLDRQALEAVFGPEYQAFNVDAWAFLEAAKATSLSVEEAEQKVVAMVYYNLATAGVLCGKTMRVVVLR
jgi:hypothetical protein